MGLRARWGRLDTARREADAPRRVGCPGEFGIGVALSANGAIALIGGSFDNHNRGAAWVFARTHSTWRQRGSKFTGNDAPARNVYFGRAVALSANGRTGLIGNYADTHGAVWFVRP